MTDVLPAELVERWTAQARPIALAIIIFAALSILAAATSDGFLEADACTHFLYARFAFQQPHYFVNVWGRPVCTGVYALPAAVAGRAGVHVASLLLAIACGLVAWRIGLNLKLRHPALALVFTLAQPLVFLHSFSELTELPFALLAGLAFLAYQRRRWFAMAVLLALAPLSRPEGFGLLLLAAIALIIHRRWWLLLVLPVPLLAWDWLGWILYGRPGHWWQWLPSNWPYAATSLYPRGSIFHFLMLMPAVTSPLIFPATCLGIWLCLRPLPALFRLSFTLHPSPILIAVLPLSILLIHSILFATGRMASSGEVRYMLIAAPFWGVLSAMGWEWLFQRMGWQHPFRAAAIAALLPILANVYYKVLPLHLGPDWLAARRFVHWHQHSPIGRRFPLVATAHQGFFYFADIAPTDGRHVLEWRRDNLMHPPPGVIALWDPVYAVYNSDAARSMPLADMLAAGWRDISDQAPGFCEGWRVLISPD